MLAALMVSHFRRSTKVTEFIINDRQLKAAAAEEAKVFEQALCSIDAFQALWRPKS